VVLKIITNNKNLIRFGTDTVNTCNNKNTAQGACGHLPKYLSNPGNRTGAINSDQSGEFTSFGAGRFQEKEGTGDRAGKCGPDNYTGNKLDSPVNRG